MTTAAAWRALLLAGLFTVWVWGMGVAQPLHTIPNPRQRDGGWVVDMAGVLNAEQKARLNRLIDALERDTGAEVAVVILKRTQGATPKEYATELFNRWGVGKRDADNGVLMLVALGDRRVEIETGYGMEAILPDAAAGEILDTAVIPRFRQGDIAGGVLAGVQAIAERIRQAQTTGAYEPTPSAFPSSDSAFPDAPAPAVQPPNSAFPYSPTPSVRPPALAAPIGLLLLGGGVILLLAYALRERPPKCPLCLQPMRLLDEQADDEYLTELQRTEEQLGSVNYHVWKCAQCDMLEIYPRVALLNSYSKCPKCNGYTVRETARVVREPTYTRSGLELVARKCENRRCDYRAEQERTLPRLVRIEYDDWHTRRRRRDDDWFLGGWTLGGGSGSWSSGGGIFGGGSSGGGGAGRSWFAAVSDDDFGTRWGGGRSGGGGAGRSWSDDDDRDFGGSGGSSGGRSFGGGSSGGGGAGRSW
ncbi:MAG: TPM domain-containing protein [Fimbriimonadales bacterium]|nr:TPM domain-containing protein [Fimbriimonadales bacterium]